MEAKEISGCNEYEAENRRIRRKNPRYEDLAEQPSTLPPSDKYKEETFKLILDSLHSEVERRQKAYESLSNTFGFF